MYIETLLSSASIAGCGSGQLYELRSLVEHNETNVWVCTALLAEELPLPLDHWIVRRLQYHTVSTQCLSREAEATYGIVHN